MPLFGLAPLGYVLLPATFGLIHGLLAKNNKSLLPDPHPTAREYLFGYQRRGWIRIQWLLNPDDTLSVTERALLVPWRQVSQLEFEPV